jgi:predicted nucleotidyltransferase
MRITPAEADNIKRIIREYAGNGARVRLFGSRLDDAAKGGDVDLMIQLSEHTDRPALLSSRIAARVSRLMHGRRVDVVIDAPNLKRLPIHDIALREGRPL